MQPHPITGDHRQPKLLLSPTETASALNMSKSKLYGLWRDDPTNAPPFLTIGKNRYVRITTLDRWLAEREQGST